MSISQMRQHYDKGRLDEEHLEINAIQQFMKWFEEASQEDVLEPNAMTLCTYGLDGFPAARVVLLKGVDDGKFVFYTNYESAKGKEIEDNPNVSLLFLWKKLQRQVRITGKASKVSKSESESYFHSRPRGSQIGAWVSPQSSVIPNKQFLDDRQKELEEKYKQMELIPLPSFWGGYCVEPLAIEFWQGRPNRLHDRIRYKKQGSKWGYERIAP